MLSAWPVDRTHANQRHVCATRVRRGMALQAMLIHGRDARATWLRRKTYKLRI